VTSAVAPSGRQWPDHSALVLLGAAAAVYTGVNLYRLAHFYSLDFDLAIFGQGVWRLSRGQVPAITIHGVNLFGEHATWIHLPIAVLYALLGPLADVRLLVLLQSAALAGAGWLLYRRAGRELGEATGVLVLLSYLAYPALQHTWLEYYEPVNLAIPCLFAATAAVQDGRERRAIAWSVLALMTVENVALTVAAVGLYALLLGRRRVGAALVAGAVVYLLLIMTVTFPWLSARGYLFADRLYGDFARSLPEAARYLARPDHLLARLLTRENGGYLLGLLGPVAFLPLGAPALLAAAVQLPLNLVSSWPYARQIRYHYVAPIVPFVFLALIHVLARLPAGSRRRRLAQVALVTGIVSGQWLYGSPWIVPRRGEVVWRDAAADAAERAGVERLLERLPAEASVSVHYRFLPALCARTRLYMFPDMGPEGTWPDALVVDETWAATNPWEAMALDRARQDGGFHEVAHTERGTVLLVRGGPGGLEPPMDRPSVSPPLARPGEGTR
jgi:uncharacterized membrane protein